MSVKHVTVEIDKHVWVYEHFDNGLVERAAAGEWDKIVRFYNFPDAPVYVRQAGWRPFFSRWGDELFNAVFGVWLDIWDWLRR